MLYISFVPAVFSIFCRFLRFPFSEIRKSMKILDCIFFLDLRARKLDVPYALRIQYLKPARFAF